MKRNLILLLSLLLLWSCGDRQSAEPRGAHPDWAYNAVVYELNVRQNSPESTFAAAEERLPMLRDLGVDVIWLMPIHPIGELNRKGSLGSYYAIRNYYEINPEFGTMADFEHFLAAAHRQGLRVILDCVANHTSPDAAWATEKPAEWYQRDSLGNPIIDYDWTDIAKLNYEVPAVREEMNRMLHFWVEKGVDGFRCDAAHLIPMDFWQQTFAELREINPDLYFLAEAEGTEFYDKAFDATYAWELHHLMNDIAQGKKPVLDLRTYLAQSSEYPAEAFRLMFTSNHDENSWAGTEFERMGDAAGTMAALTYVLPQGQPLIYTGQEVGFNRRFAFFESDPVDSWEPNEYTDFYRRLNRLRHANPALAAGERGGESVYMTGTEDRLLAFTRTVGDNRVFALFNLSAEPVPALYTVDVAGDYVDAMTGEPVVVEAGTEDLLGAWEYRILTQNAVAEL